MGKIMKGLVIVIAFTASVLQGCAHPVSPPPSFMGVSSRSHTSAEKYYKRYYELQQKWLPFLEDGTTTKREIEQTLGQPTTRYEDGKIWAYSIQLTEARAGEIGIPEPETIGIPEPETIGIPEPGTTVISESESYVGHYSLVLVFDEKNILKRHSLVKVYP
jgi:hypothetical protein